MRPTVCTCQWSGASLSNTRRVRALGVMRWSRMLMLVVRDCDSIRRVTVSNEIARGLVSWALRRSVERATPCCVRSGRVRTVGVSSPSPLPSVAPLRSGGHRRVADLLGLGQPVGDGVPLAGSHVDVVPDKIALARLAVYAHALLRQLALAVRVHRQQRAALRQVTLSHSCWAPKNPSTLVV